MRNRVDHETMRGMDDTSKLREELRAIGQQRQAALDAAQDAREKVLAKLPAARAADLTWREIAALTHYTETRLQRMLAEREAGTA